MENTTIKATTTAEAVKEIKLIELIESDNFQATYIGTYKGKNCYITIPLRKTSWNFSVSY